MSNEAKIFKYNTLSDVAVRFRSDLNDFDYVLVYAYNGTGKTRLSMEFKNRGRDTEANTRDTLYFNAFTEDLFIGITTLKMIWRGFSRSMQTRTSLTDSKN